MNRPPIKEGFAYFGVLQLPLRSSPKPDGYEERAAAAKAQAEAILKDRAEQKRLERAYRNRANQLAEELSKS